MDAIQVGLQLPSPAVTLVGGQPLQPSELIIAMGLGDMTLSDRLEECRREGSKGSRRLSSWITWKEPPGLLIFLIFHVPTLPRLAFRFNTVNQTAKHLDCRRFCAGL